MKEKNGILSGAIYLGLSAFIAKFLGAIYRVPLTNMLGSYGIGLYQMVFPVYSLLLDFSGAGLPSAISRLISKSEDRYKTAHKFLVASLKIFFIFGLICSLFMWIFGSKIAILQGDSKARLPYLFLSPAILLVSIISCFRGYFQGLMNMRPTALSQVIEQIIKLLFGVLLVRLFLPDVEKAVSGATFAITLSELVAVLYLFILYIRHKNKYKLHFIYDNSEFFNDGKTIVKNTIPITLVGIMIPLSQVLDSFLTINILGKYMQNATSVFGVLSGVVMTIINLPVSICYGLATVAIPAISGVRSQSEKDKRKNKILLLTLLFALPCSVGLALFSPLAINILFRNLAQFEKTTAINLLRLCSPCVVLLSLVQASNAILIGKGKLYTPVITLSIGVVIKTVLNLLLLSDANLNIYGGAIAIIACYFFVCLINLILLTTKRKANENTSSYPCRQAS